MAVLKAAFGDTPIMIEYDDFIKNLGHFKKKKKSHPTILLSCALSLNSELHAVTLIEGCVQSSYNEGQRGTNTFHFSTLLRFILFVLVQLGFFVDLRVSLD